jgi:hypothetical protein
VLCWLQRECGIRWPWTAVPLCNLSHILSGRVNQTALTTSGLDCVDLAWAAGSITLRIGTWWTSSSPNRPYVRYCFVSPDTLHVFCCPCPYVHCQYHKEPCASGRKLTIGDIFQLQHKTKMQEVCLQRAVTVCVILTFNLLSIWKHTKIIGPVCWWKAFSKCWLDLCTTWRFYNSLVPYSDINKWSRV